MKHLFIVHSHICYYMADAIIKNNNIKPEDVLLLTCRNYHPKTNSYSLLKVDSISNMTSSMTIIKLLKVNKQIRKLDRLVLQYIQDESFVAYVPHMSMLISQILVSNKKCVGFNYVEEGLAYYVEKNFAKHFINFSKPLKLIFSVYNKLNSRIELGHSVFGPFKDFTTPSYYFIDSKYAPKRKDVVTVSLDNCNEINEWSDIKFLLVLSASYEFNMCSLNSLLTCYARIIDEMHIDTTLYVKKHPQTGSETTNAIEKFLSDKDIDFFYIDEAVEEIMMKADKRDIVVAGIDSSLLFYSNILNKSTRVIAGYKYLMSIDEVYRMRCGLVFLDYLFDDVIIV